MPLAKTAHSNGKGMEKHLFELIFSLKRKCLSTEERIRNEYQLSHSEFTGLLALNPEEQIFGNTFAERLGLSPSRGSRVLTKMLDSGFVQTAIKPNDRRSVSISLTKNGVRMKKNVESKLNECESRIVATFSIEQVKQIKDMLMMLDEVL